MLKQRTEGTRLIHKLFARGGLNKLKVTRVFDFASEDQAHVLMDWLTKNGFDDYSTNDIRRVGRNRFGISLLDQYGHHADAIQSIADKITAGEIK